MRKIKHLANPFRDFFKIQKNSFKENVFDVLFNAVFIRFLKTAKVQLTDRNRNEEFRFF
jgi:hypothetical protein